MSDPREVRLEKVTVNIGVGEGGEKLERAVTLLERATEAKAVKTQTMKRIPAFGVRPKALIGAKATLRGKRAEEFLKRALDAIDFKVKENSFDETGNFSFGIHEYIDLPGLKYDPKLGIFGMDVCVTLSRPGYRVKRRSVRKSKVGKSHRVTKEEAKEFAKGLGVEIV